MKHKRKIIGFIAMMTGLIASAQSILDRIDIHGFISQGYIISSNNNYLNLKTSRGSYEMNESAINFSTNITDNLRGGLQLLSRDLGKVGNNVVMLDWAYADYRIRDYLGIRLGKIKTPLALYDEIRDVDALRTFILLPQSVYDENVRDFSFAFQGAALYGNYQMGIMGDLDYNLYMGTFNIPDPNTGFWHDSFSNLANEVKPVIAKPSSHINEVSICNADISAEYIWGFSGYWNSPFTGLKIGGCYLIGSIDMSVDIEAFSEKTLKSGDSVEEISRIPMTSKVKIKDYYTLSGEYAIQNLTLTGEYHSRIYRVHVNLPENGFMTDLSYQLIGYYGQATYRLTEWLEAGTYYSFYDDVDSHIKGISDWYFTQKDICGAIRFDITPNFLIKLEGHKINGVGLALACENPSERTRNWNLFTVKSSLNL
ncbi:hypothetical protein JW835_04030 [bacterium]|nr:hypothetical protein [bacterium]RQV97963.1 MAG: hypothetical protein EH221_03125 [bacterium]